MGESVPMGANLLESVPSAGSACDNRDQNGRDASGGAPGAKNPDFVASELAPVQCVAASGGGTVSPGDDTMTMQQIRWSRIQLISCCCVLFLVGWVDGTTGPLLPRIQEWYSVSAISENIKYPSLAGR